MDNRQIADIYKQGFEYIQDLACTAPKDKKADMMERMDRISRICELFTNGMITESEGYSLLKLAYVGF